MKSRANERPLAHSNHSTCVRTYILGHKRRLEFSLQKEYIFGLVLKGLRIFRWNTEKNSGHLGGLVEKRTSGYTLINVICLDCLSIFVWNPLQQVAVELGKKKMLHKKMQWSLGKGREKGLHEKSVINIYYQNTFFDFTFCSDLKVCLKESGATLYC